MFRTVFCEKETKVSIIADTERHAKAAVDEIRKQRALLESYISGHELFGKSLVPVDVADGAPLVVRMMADGSDLAGVGPMAAVAGVIAELSCRRMRDMGSRVCVVENGGDIFAISDTEVRVALFAGRSSPLKGVCMTLGPSNTPVSVCSSSSFMGHSLSLGKCDLVTVISEKSSVADSFATAVCNRIKSAGDMKPALDWAAGFRDVTGVVAVKGGSVSMVGDVSCLGLHEDPGAEGKITSHHAP